MGSPPPPSIGFWAEVARRAEAALAAGAMHSFECAIEYVEDAGVEFVLRVATRFPQGETAAGRGPQAPRLPADPFADPEPALVVRDLTGTHRAMLNKFSVLREHLLVVTKDFEDQRLPLSLADFGALVPCMEDAEVLAFYNGGLEAGASQAHKHLQVVPLPLSPRRAVPMAALLERPGPPLPFRHAYARLAPGQAQDPAAMLATYRELHRRAGLEFPQPYNLLATHEWMLVVPRARDRFEGVSVNALAFAGSFFVRDARHAHIIASSRPMSVLESVAMP